jgi:UDP-glucoronosyl and UDP-glucosyl transferase
VLVASTAGAGHFGPLRPVLDATSRLGAELLVVVPPGLKVSVEAAGHPYRLGADPPREELATLWARLPTLPPREAAVLVEREIFGRLCTAAMLPALEEACREWRPDLVLREPCEYAAAIAADRCGIAHAQVAISLADIEAGSLALAAPALEVQAEGIVERIRASPYLTRFPGSIDPSPYVATRRFREAPGAFLTELPDWWGGSDTPLVYLTFGTVAGGLPIGPPTYRAALDAMAGLPTRVLLTIGQTVEISSLGPMPANVHAEPWVAQDQVFCDAAVVVCHGGSGTTFGALSAGVPLVIVPLFADQPTNARRLSEAGAALVVEPGGSAADGMTALGPDDVPRLRAAVETVLADNSYQRNARTLASEMRSLPVIDDVLAELAGATRRG